MGYAIEFFLQMGLLTVTGATVLASPWSAFTEWLCAQHEVEASFK